MTQDRQIEFRLYIAGETLNSVKAITNLNDLCVSHLDGNFTVEIIDVLEDSARCLIDSVFMTPTLMKLSPRPIVRIVGNLSDRSSLLSALKI